jgi:hypothetical protein
LHPDSHGNSLIVAVVASGADGFAPSSRTGTSLYETAFESPATWGAGHQYQIQSTPAQFNITWGGVGGDDFGVCIAIFNEIEVGISVSKAAAVAVTGPAKGVSVSKLVAYAVLATKPGGDFWPILLRII